MKCFSVSAVYFPPDSPFCGFYEPLVTYDLEEIPPGFLPIVEGQFSEEASSTPARRKK